LTGEGFQLQANGLPLESTSTDEDLHGGSGGYIYINTSNEVTSNYVSPGAQIQARGGFGKNRGFGGAGGSVVGGLEFAYIFNVDTEGGLAGDGYKNAEPAGCGNAAAGTSYYWTLDLMLIDNKDHISNKHTQLSATQR